MASDELKYLLRGPSYESLRHPVQGSVYIARSDSYTVATLGFLLDSGAVRPMGTIQTDVGRRYQV